MYFYDFTTVFANLRYKVSINEMPKYTFLLHIIFPILEEKIQNYETS